MIISGPGCLDTSCRQTPVWCSKSTYLDEESRLSNINIYPNPTTENTVLAIESASEEKIKIQIQNALGSSIFEVGKNVSPGINNFSLPSANLSSGLYIVRVLDSRGNVKTLRLLKN